MTFFTASAVATAGVLVAMLLMIIRLVMGPSLYDRVLAVNSFGTKTVLLLAILNFLMGRPEFLDLALLYSLINFVSTIAVLKFFRYRKFDEPLAFVSGNGETGDAGKIETGDEA